MDKPEERFKGVDDIPPGILSKVFSMLGSADLAEFIVANKYLEKCFMEDNVARIVINLWRLNNDLSQEEKYTVEGACSYSDAREKDTVNRHLDMVDEIVQRRINRIPILKSFYFRFHLPEYIDDDTLHHFGTLWLRTALLKNVDCLHFISRNRRINNLSLFQTDGVGSSSLQVLKLDSVNIQSTHQGIPYVNVKELELVDCIVDNGVLKSLGSLFPVVKSLIIRRLEESNEFIPNKEMSCLESIELFQCEDMSKVELKAPVLSEFLFRGYSNMSEFSLNLGACLNLKKLVLIRVPIDGRELEIMMRDLVHLEDVDLRVCTRVANITIKSRGVKKVTLWCCPHMRSPTFQPTVEKFCWVLDWGGGVDYDCLSHLLDTEEKYFLMTFNLLYSNFNLLTKLMQNCNSSDVFKMVIFDPSNKGVYVDESLSVDKVESGLYRAVKRIFENHFPLNPLVYVTGRSENVYQEVQFSDPT